MRRRGRIAVIAVAAAFMLYPALADAGLPIGELEITYTGTSDSMNGYPDRFDHRTYSPCSGLERLVGIGGTMIESAPSEPNRSEFALGKAYTTGIEPFDQIPGPPIDSTQHTGDNLFTIDNDLTIVESTTCAEAPGQLAYRDETKKSGRRARTTVKAACPGDKHVLSGGGVATGPFRSQLLVSSAPFDSADPGAAPDDGWKVVVDNLKRKRRPVDAHAICSSVTGTSYVTDQFRTRKRSRKNVQLECPAGEHVIGGGVTHSGPYGKATLVGSHLSVPFDTGWVIEVDNLKRKRTSGRAFAICHA